MKYEFAFLLCGFIVAIQGSLMENLMQRQGVDDFEMAENLTDNQELQRRRRNAPGFCKKPSRVYSPDFHRNVSEMNCYQFLWDVSYISFKDKKEQSCKKYSPQHRLADSYPVQEGEFPHMAALGWHGVKKGDIKFRCGGSLISRFFVLTAAFCVYIHPPDMVRLGTKDLTKGGKDYNVKRTIVHPEHEHQLFYYDIALLELEERVHFTVNLQPACLWSYDHYGVMYSQLQMTGWGARPKSGLYDNPHSSEFLSNELTVADMDVDDECIEADNGMRIDHNRQLCLHSADFESFTNCQFDSGGPISLKIPLTNSTQGHMHFIVGVISGYHKCGGYKNRGHTKVSTYIDWISSIVWPSYETLPKSPSRKQALYLIPKSLKPTDQLVLNLFTRRSELLIIKLLLDKGGPDYTNVALQVNIDFDKSTIYFKAVKDGVVINIDYELNVEPFEVITENLVDIAFRKRKTTNYLDLSVGNKLIFAETMIHDLEKVRYFTLEGAGVLLKKLTFQKSYPFDPE